MNNIIHIQKKRIKPSGTFMLHYMGIHEAMPPKFVNRPAGTDSFLFVFFYSPATIRLNAKEFSCRPNTFMLWPPGSPHNFGSVDSRWDHSWFYWDGKIITRLLNQCGIAMNQPIPFNSPDVVDHYLFQIHDELSSYVNPDQIIVQHHLHIMFRVMRRILEGEKQINTIPNQLLQIRRFLNINFHKTVSLTQLSSHFDISIPHLCSEFKKYFHISPIEYLIQLRIQQAVNLMHDYEMTIYQIAQKVGYEDPYYFSKVFKKRHGLSPRKYRIKLIKN